MAIQGKQALTTIAKLAVAAGLIAWIVSKGAIDFTALKALASPQNIAVALGLTFLLIFINNQRWLVLLRAQGVNSSIRQTLPLSLIGMFFNYAMPGGVGGDLVKGYYLIQDHPDRRFPAAISILLDRLIGFFVMIMTATLALAVNWSAMEHSRQLRAMGVFLLILFACFVFAFALAFSSALEKFSLSQWIFKKVPGGKILERIYESLRAYRKTPGALLKAIALSVLSQLTFIFFAKLVGDVMGYQQIPFSVYCFLVPIGIVATAIPVSPAGIGVGQAAFYFLFNLYLGEPSQLGPTAVTAMQISQFAWGLFGAYFYLRRGKVSPTVEQFG